MKELRTYEFGADKEALRIACESGAPPARAEAAFRAMVTEIVSRVREAPRSVYLCSPDADAEARDRFALLLSKLLREHIPTILLVDCGFLSTGMSGIVPHRDALGFLDLLLYGTSLGVITQEAPHGVRVVGAGSFAVTKKSPFVMEAFVGARRYLVNQAKCVVFVGPATDDEEHIHPVAGHVDLVVLLRLGDRFGERLLDPVEDKVAAIEGVEAWSVRVNTGMAAPEGAAAGVSPRAEPTLVAEVEELVDKMKEEATPVSPKSTPAEPGRSPARPARAEMDLERRERAGAREPVLKTRQRKRAVSARLVRVTASMVAIAVLAVIVWWVVATWSDRDRSGKRPGAGHSGTAAVPPPSPAAIPQPAESLLAGRTDTLAKPVPGPRSSAGKPDTTAVSKPASTTATPLVRTPGQSATGQLSTTDSIYFAQTLDQFVDRYVVHVGSFRGIQKAQEEAFYLLGWGFPVFIYHVDLGDKGTWYRVYVGPCATREEAMANKIKLDENPRIKSTRVSKVPG